MGPDVADLAHRLMDALGWLGAGLAIGAVELAHAIWLRMRGSA